MSAHEEILALGAKHGLVLEASTLDVIDMGLDFRVVLARASDGEDWVLRIPRRPDVLPGARHEKRVLDFVRPRLSVAAPDWRVFSDDLIAYPRLPGRVGLSYDPATQQVDWVVDRDSPAFIASFAKLLAQLHALPKVEAEQVGLPTIGMDEARAKLEADMADIRATFGVADALWARWQDWLDDAEAWPDHVTFNHGDLYPAHVLIDETQKVLGVIDWTEAGYGDPGIDFVHHLMAFGPERFDAMVAAYANAGGRVWPGLRRHVEGLTAAGPIRYARYAQRAGDATHLEAARAQLNGETG